MKLPKPRKSKEQLADGLGTVMGLLLLVTPIIVLLVIRELGGINNVLR